MSEFYKEKNPAYLWFGDFLQNKGEDNFIVTVEVVVDKAFFGWLTSMGRNVHILKPKKAAVAYRDYLKNIAKDYKGIDK